MFIMYYIILSFLLVERILLVASAVSPNTGSYLITFPRQCYVGTANNFFVQFWADQDINLNLTIRKLDKYIPLFERVISKDLSGQLLTFPVELPLDEDQFSNQLHVEASGGISVKESVFTSFTAPIKPKLLIQTDKPIYKPGQTVLLRVLGINWELKPLSDKETVNVSVTDGGGSRILQWSNISLQQGFLSLNFSISARPVLGVWHIDATTSSKLSAQKEVEIAKYVMPKFEVTIKAPAGFISEDPLLSVVVCARYTYGQPVAGVTSVLACMHRNSWFSTSPATEWCTITVKPTKGCETVDIKLDELMKAEFEWNSVLSINASFAERGTGLVLNSSTVNVPLQYNKVNINFVNAPNFYKPGAKLKVFIEVKSMNSRMPAPSSISCTVIKGEVSYSEDVLLNKGVGSMEISTADTSAPITIQAVHQSTEDDPSYYTSRSIQTHHISVWFSPSSSHITFRPQNGPFLIRTSEKMLLDYHLNGTQAQTIYYMLYCLGKLRHQGVVTIPLSEETDEVRTGTLTIPVTIDKDAAPVCRLLAMLVREDKEVVADSIELTIHEHLPNMMDLSFILPEVQPGEGNVLQIKAAPGSRYAITGIDRSVELLRASSDFGLSDVISYQLQKDLKGVPFYQRSCPMPKDQGSFSDYQSRSYGFHHNYEDSSKAFQDLGLLFITNLNIEVAPCSPIEAVEMQYEDQVMEESESIADEKGIVTSPSPTLKVRKDFPETWLWLDGTVGNDGSASVNVTVPDTITSWTVRGFAVSDVDGVGFAVPTSLKVFQPFFLSLMLPYSAVRMERVTIPMSIFNYLDSCLTVHVYVAPSSQFKLVRRQYALVGIEAQQSTVYSFTVQPLVIGHITIRVQAETGRSHSHLCRQQSNKYSGHYIGDILEEKLLVEPQGVKKHRVNSTFVCVQGSSHVEQLSISLPTNIVPDSVKASFSVVGDVMGPSMSNIGELIRMPYGCGEQNMINFAPNIYILQYLQATGQNQEDVIKKAKDFMVQGYQRQLSYKRSDGSYAAFGQREPHGSTWLTAFVVKSYSQARRFIPIDEKDINDSIQYLYGMQKDDGCYNELGEVHEKSLMGGMNGDGTLLTTFVLNALLEAGHPNWHQAVSSGLKCLLSKSDTITSSYGLAVLAYTLSLAQHPQAEKTLSQLWDKATTQDGLTWWSSPKTSDKHTPYSWFNWQAKPNDIEAAGYALLATLGGYGKQEGINRGVGVIRWLSRQRNSLGGFASTQDTCVALQSLAEFSRGRHTDATDLSIQIAPSTGSPVQFYIKRDNKLLLQTTEVSVPAVFTTTVLGTGCLLLQAAVEFNVFSVTQEKVFDLQVSVQKSTTSSCSPALTVCASYILGGETNMALVEVHFWTGFTAVVEDLDQALVPGFNLQQFEVDGGKLTLYFSKMALSPTCITFRVQSSVPAESIAAKPVLVYDYYDNQKLTTVMNPFKKDYCSKR